MQEENKMPYIPSEKTDGKSMDRKIIDAAVEELADKTASKIKSNLSLIDGYESVFLEITDSLRLLLRGNEDRPDNPTFRLALAIFENGKQYDYEGAYLGELNYAITRLIQRVPQIKAERGEWKQEFRYWLYAATVEALINASRHTQNLGLGVSGVFEDVKDEYKRRVNVAYEAEKIIESGDCYDASYYTKLVKVVDEDDNFIGYQEVMLKRDKETLGKDLLESCIVLKKTSNKPGR